MRKSGPFESNSLFATFTGYSPQNYRFLNFCQILLISAILHTRSCIWQILHTRICICQIWHTRSCNCICQIWHTRFRICKIRDTRFCICQIWDTISCIHQTSNTRLCHVFKIFLCVTSEYKWIQIEKVWLICSIFTLFLKFPWLWRVHSYILLTIPHEKVIFRILHQSSNLTTKTPFEYMFRAPN